MKTIVITILDDVCAANGKDPEATNLIEVAKSYGKVEYWESAVATERTKYQSIINNLTAQLDAISENNVSPTELEVLKAVRKKANVESSAYEQAIAERDAQLKAVQLESENRATQIKAILGL